MTLIRKIERLTVPKNINHKDLKISHNMSVIEKRSARDGIWTSDLWLVSWAPTRSTTPPHRKNINFFPKLEFFPNFFSTFFSSFFQLFFNFFWTFFGLFFELFFELFLNFFWTFFLTFLFSLFLKVFLL